MSAMALLPIFLFIGICSGSAIQRSVSVSRRDVSPICGPAILDADHGTISSPGFPGNYPNNVHCEWTIRVKPDKRIELEVLSLEIEDEYPCEHDYVEVKQLINGTDATFPRICDHVSSTAMEPVQSVGSSFKIIFHADSTNTSKGFQLRYWTIDGVYQGTRGCGGVIANDRGSINAPRFSGLTEFIEEPKLRLEPEITNVNCKWVFYRETDKRIQFRFQINSLAADQHDDCNKNYIEIKETKGDEDIVLGHFCSHIQAPTITTSGRNVSIIFRSGKSTRAQDFRIDYAALPDEGERPQV